MSDFKIYGFSCLRNGVKYDYPFVESFKSLVPLVEKTVIAFDDGVDESRKHLAEIPSLELKDYKWPDHILNGNSIGVMTNYAIEELRNNEDVENAWGMYLQADELLLETEIEQIKADIKFAHENGYDCVRFRYIHFWEDHNKIACGKRWYPQEIRAIKLNSKIRNHGDGQTFDTYEKPYESNCHVFHYGHVRDASAYKDKMEHFHSLYYTGLRLFRKNFIQNYLKKEPVWEYRGRHPRLMWDRIKKLGGETNFKKPSNTMYVCDDKAKYSQELINSFDVSKVEFIKSKSEVPSGERKYIVYPTKKSKVGFSLKSPLARKWEPEFLLVMKASEKGFSQKNR